jgi:hypothetical protein
MYTSKKPQKLIKWMIAVSFFLLWALTCWLPGATAARPAQAMPKVIVLDDKENHNSKYAGFKGNQGKAPFDHEQHVDKEKSCAICHHTNSDKLTTKLEEEVLKCSVCHTDADEVETTVASLNADERYKKGTPARNIKLAFHGDGGIAGCIDCHREREVKPIGCDDCHTKSDKIEYQYKK